jgi:hypothetical protein
MLTKTICLSKIYDIFKDYHFNNPSNSTLFKAVKLIP